MAHMVLLHLLDVNHDRSNDYVETLFNLDTVISIEPSKVHSIIYTRWNDRGIKVKESLEEILALSKESDGNKGILHG